ncbi:hypothetical protein EMIT0215P_90076 [Pseudomonas serboccidentalis]
MEYVQFSKLKNISYYKLAGANALARGLSAQYHKVAKKSLLIIYSFVASLRDS